MIQTIVVDLDGPVLDGKLKHYNCYSYIMRLHGFVPKGIAEYWQMKRQRVELIKQLEMVGAESVCDLFGKLWLELIEQPTYLAMDRLQPGAREKLIQWREQGINLILATLRHNPAGLREQLSKLKLDMIFDHILVCEHLAGGKGKADGVRNLFPNIKTADVLWVGDTEVDIEAARILECPVWAVSCGIRTEAFLASLLPNYLSQFLAEIDIGKCVGSAQFT